PVRKSDVLLLKHGNRRLATLGSHDVVEQVENRAVVSVWKKGVTVTGQEPGVRRSAHALDGAVIGDEAVGLELLEMMPDRIERATQLLGQLLGRGTTAALELQQDLAPGTLVPDRAGKRGCHLNLMRTGDRHRAQF